MISGIERLTAAMAGKQSDRIPVFCNLLDQGAIELGMSLSDYYAKGEYVAQGQIRMRAKYGYDNVWCLFYVGRDAELLGCKSIVYADDGPPNVGEFIINAPADIRNLTIPDTLAEIPAFEQELECLRLLREEVAGKHPICVYVTATMALPAILMGMERWLELIMLGPESDRNLLLEKCHEYFVKKALAYRAGGADVILYSNPFGSTDIIPMPFFLNTSLPWIRQDIDAIDATGVVYYCGMARMNSVLDHVASKTAIPAYYLSPLDDIAEAKSKIAGRALTCGVVNDIQLIDWTEEQIHGEVNKIIHDGMPGGRFLFGTGVMPYGIPESSIRTMLEAAFYSGRQDSVVPS